MSLGELKEMTYQEIAYTVMKEFLTDFTEEELKSCIAKAYDSKFDTEEIAPLAKVEDAYYLELFHGATIASKDMALSILPHLLTTSAKKNQVKNEIVILTANIRGYRKSCTLQGFADGRRNQDHRILSEERSQPRTGAADGNTERETILPLLRSTVTLTTH